jgi:hypothetical protein
LNMNMAGLPVFAAPNIGRSRRPRTGELITSRMEVMQHRSRERDVPRRQSRA